MVFMVFVVVLMVVVGDNDYGGGGDCRRGGLTSSAPYHRTRRVESSADVKLNSLTLKPLYYGKGVSVAPAAGSGSESDGAR